MYRLLCTSPSIGWYTHARSSSSHTRNRHTRACMQIETQGRGGKSKNKMAATLTQAHCRDAFVARATPERHAHVMSSAGKKIWNVRKRKRKALSRKSGFQRRRSCIRNVGRTVSAPLFECHTWSALIVASSTWSQDASFFLARWLPRLRNAVKPYREPRYNKHAASLNIVKWLCEEQFWSWDRK